MNLIIYFMFVLTMQDLLLYLVNASLQAMGEDTEQYV